MSSASWNPRSYTCSHTNTHFLRPVYPRGYRRHYIHLWPCGCNEVGESTSLSSGSNTCVYLCRCVCALQSRVASCVCGERSPLQAVIHGRLFQTMPLYRSPFILAAGCLGAAGALWQILKEGSPSAAILREETQLEPWLYCLKGAVQPKVKSRGRRGNMIKWRRGAGESVALLQIYCLFV